MVHTPAALAVVPAEVALAVVAALAAGVALAVVALVVLPMVLPPGQEPCDLVVQSIAHD